MRERTRRGASTRFRAASVALAGLALSLGLASDAAARSGPTIAAQLHPDEVALGQEARLSVTITGLQSAPAPSIPAIDGLDIRSIGQTMSMQIVGGQITSDVTHNFVVRPSRLGRFTIPALSVATDDANLETNPVTLRVVAAGQVPKAQPPAQGQAQNRAGARQRPSAQDRQDPAAEAAPLRLSLAGVPERALWVGELIPIEIRLDVRADVQVTEVTSPKIEGHVFSLTQPSEQQQPQPTAVTIGGVRYARFLLPAAISPVTVGDHDLELSMTATALVAQARRRSAFDDPFFDSFFGGRGRERREIPVATAARKIRVNALPEAGRPADFSGGIGRFRVSAKAAPTELAVGDPLTLEVTITGEGNFDRTALPPLETGIEWKTYPQTSKSKFRDHIGHAGSKTFEQVIIPERVDAQAVPARELAYFDPDQGRYERASTEPIALVLRAAPRAPAGVGGAATRPGREAADESGAFEIAPNQIELGSLRRSLAPLARSPLFLALQLVPLALVAAGFAWARRRERLAGDVGHQRAVAASRAVRAELKRAEQAASRGDATAFFAAARRALQERVATPDRAAASSTLDDVENAIPGDSPARDTVRAIFAMADAVAYSGAPPEAGQLQDWRRRLVEAIRALPAGGGGR